MHHDPASWGLLAQVHLGLALIIAAAYLSVPFTALRKLARFLPRTAQISGALFFLTCAITHLSIASGFDSRWMVVSDLVQAISVVTFIASFSRLVGRAFERRARRMGVADVDQ